MAAVRGGTGRGRVDRDGGGDGSARPGRPDLALEPFWQSPQGAGELATRTHAAIMRSKPQLQPATGLRERVLGITGDETVEAVLHRFTARRSPPLLIGPMVRALLVASGAGDAVASTVVREHGILLSGRSSSA